MKKKSIKTGPKAWSRYREGRSFYYVYSTTLPNTWKLLDTGNYGVVQLRCIDNTAQAAFMAGFRAGRRSDNG